MSRRSARNRHRQPAAKARTGPAPRQDGASFTGQQLATIIAATQAVRTGQRATPLPRPADWSNIPFPPGSPLTPGPINRVRPSTGRAEPRLFELPVSTNVNIATAPFVPWQILDQAADMPLFRKCIKRRQGVCDLDFAVTVDPRAVAREAALAGQHEKDVESAMRARYAPDIARISDWLETPDAQNNQDWTAWGKALFENRLRYDAAVVYPQRSIGGDLLAWRVIDGSTIKPLLDEYAARPAPPYPAFQQILYGFPRGEFHATPLRGPGGKPVLGIDGNPVIPGASAADELYYERTTYRPKSPYGMSDTEIALLDGLIWMRRMGWILAEYTEGVMPDAFLKVSGETDWTYEQWADWLRVINDHLGGNTGERFKFNLMPPGVDPVLAATVAERYKPEYDMLLIKLVAGDFGLTATELGFPEVGSLGASFHEGEEDVLNRVTRRPDARWLGAYATKLAVRELAMPPVLQVQVLGLESEDEAAADAVADAQVRGGRMTLNQDNDRRGMPAYDFPEADMPMLMLQRGVVFLEGASKLGPPGSLIEPAQAPPDQGGSPEAAPGGGQDDDEPSAQPPHPGSPAGKSIAAEITAYRRWARKGGQRGTFTTQALERADAPPEMAADTRVVFKADASPEGRPKVTAAGTGPAGSGTRN